MVEAHRRTEMNRGIPRRIRSFRQHYSPRLEVTRSRCNLVDPCQINVVVNDGSPGLEARGAHLSAISSGVRGTFSLRSLGVAPFMATSMITGWEAICGTVARGPLRREGIPRALARPGGGQAASSLSSIRSRTNATSRGAMEGL